MASTGDEDDDLDGEFVPGTSPIWSPPVAGRASVSGEDRDEEVLDARREEADLADIDEDDERENTYDGAYSTWRSLTKDERSLAASLDRQQANNLSSHLLNAHGLKARLRGRHAVTKFKPYHGKHRWIQPNEDGTLPWHPDAAWTAWPLQPDEVPRSMEQFGASVKDFNDDDGTFKKPEPWKPSAALEEEVQALILREANERFHARQWEISAGEDSPIEPNFLADDEGAGIILQPSVRHVLSKLDDLLLALHRQRKGHAREGSEWRSLRSRRVRSNSKSKSSAGEPPSATAGTLAKMPLPSKGGEQLENQNPATGTAESQPKKTPKRKRPLNPRDWSDIISTASLIGWNPAVVDRAAHRCSTLFGESMTFTAVQEMSSNGRNRDQVEAPMDGPEANSAVETAKAPPLLYVCPLPSCKRHFEHYDLAWRWREHMKRSHKYSSEQVQEVEAQLPSGDGGTSDVRQGSKAAKHKADNPPNQAAATTERISASDLLEPIVVNKARGKDVRRRKARGSKKAKVEGKESISE